jgi:transcriptional regulator with XRE-family HTH domain
MGRTFVYPRRKADTPCSHPLLPKLSQPWWEYTCAHCTPGCWKTFTEPDFRAEDKRPSVVECPLCLWNVQYRGGKMRRHWEDRGEDCRCSGLSELVAHRYVDALLAGKSLMAFVSQSLQRRGIALAPEPVAKEPETIVEQLADLRRQKDWSQAHVAARLRTSRTTVLEWEAGANRPLLDCVIRWADVLDARLVLTGENTVMAVDKQATISWWLKARRGQESINKLAARMGVGSKALGRWESGRTSFRLVDLQDWTDALGLAVELRGKVEA